MLGTIKVWNFERGFGFAALDNSQGTFSYMRQPCSPVCVKSVWNRASALSLMLFKASKADGQSE
jgi:hypothetical protein